MAVFIGRGLNDGSASGLAISRHLASLDAAWDIWSGKAATKGRIIARARLYLLFLLIRHAGLRLGEALRFTSASIDAETGLIGVKGIYRRDIFLSPAAMRPLRRILALPEAAQPDFARLDAGFVRRAFYAVAKEAGLTGAQGGPRALRYARGLELLATHMPLSLVLDYLGLDKPKQMDAFLRFANLDSPMQLASNDMTCDPRNILPVIIGSMELGAKSVSIALNTLTGLRLSCICPISIFMKREPIYGETALASILPEWIILAHKPLRQQFANNIPCSVRAIVREDIESGVLVAHEDKAKFMVAMDTSLLDSNKLAIGQPVFACFSARAINLASE